MATNPDVDIAPNHDVIAVPNHEAGEAPNNNSEISSNLAFAGNPDQAFSSFFSCGQYASFIVSFFCLVLFDLLDDHLRNISNFVFR